MKISNSFVKYNHFLPQNTAQIKQKHSYNQKINELSFQGKEPEAKSSFPIMFLDRNQNVTCLIGNITLNQNTTKEYIITKDIIDDYLTTNGSFNNDLALKYMSIYGKILQTFEEKNKNLNACLDKVSQKNPEFDNTKEENSNSSPLDFLSSTENKELKNSLEDELKKEIQLNDKNRHYKNSKTAHRQTQYIFKMSENEIGYNFSNLEHKISLSQIFDDIQNEFETEENGDYISEIIESSKDERGNFNCNFAEYLCELILNINTFYPDTLVSLNKDVLERFLNKDEEHFTEIGNALIELTSLFSIEEDNIFEEIFENAFNPITEEFDIDAFNLVVDSVLAAEANSDEEYSENEDEEEYSSKREYVKEFTEKYFDKARNEKTGHIINNPISPFDFNPN